VSRKHVVKASELVVFKSCAPPTYQNVTEFNENAQSSLNPPLGWGTVPLVPAQSPACDRAGALVSRQDIAVGSPLGLPWRNPDRIGRLMPWFANPKQKETLFRPAHFAIVCLSAVIAVGNFGNAASARSERSMASVESRTASEPIMAIVSLQSQQITVYDSEGWILRAPVSSGQRGRETPAGIFSVIEKEAEHYSNLYDDAYMPNMERLTWSGIALHGGSLPGHPASHGCVRMPYDFAERLFETTPLGMRVIVAPTDVAPVAIAHPALFQPKPDAGAAAAARAAEADEASSKADQTRLAVMTASREVAQAMVPVRALRNLKLRAETQLAAAERAMASSGLAEAQEQAGGAKAKAAAKIAELEAQMAAAEAELQPKLDLLTAAREAAVTTETARVEAAEAARIAVRDLKPVSVFISRKTQRLYLRQAFQPILEIPVTIRDPDLPIGTHVFTALERTDGGGDIQWSVVSLVGGHPDDRMPGVQSPGPGEGRVEQMWTEALGAKAALDRIALPRDTIDQIEAIVSPRSSLIISDEALSSETGRGTEFIILLSGEPQGGINIRRRHPETVFRYESWGDRLPYWRAPFASPYSTW
jgi:L,D-transpeptidase catalytic domain